MIHSVICETIGSVMNQHGDKNKHLDPSFKAKGPKWSLGFEKLFLKIPWIPWILACGPFGPLGFKKTKTIPQIPRNPWIFPARLGANKEKYFPLFPDKVTGLWAFEVQLPWI